MMKTFMKDWSFPRLVGALHAVPQQRKSAKRKVFPMFFVAVLLTLSPLGAAKMGAQTRAKANWQGHWNWAVYAKDKSELPPAYQDVTNVREIPAYALDLTLRQRGNRLRGSWGLLARYLARIDEGDITARIKGNRATMRLTSNFGGSATIVLTLRGNQLSWKLTKSSGENFFPRNEVLHRLRPNEKLPYVADEGTEDAPE